MKFIHMADCHIDGYREKKLADLGFQNFQYVINYAIEKKVDFVLIAGDLFNTALPRVDALKDTTAELKKLHEHNIPVYIIPGSHDYSPHGRTMLDVLELAGLVKNVANFKDNKLEFTIDSKTNVQITGIMGRAGMLDQQLYKNLQITKPKQEQFSIFMFHTSIQELITNRNIPAASVSLLPEGFNYYAGGHIHIRKIFSNATHKQVVYPGPTFPNSFSELEELESGSFIYYDQEPKQITIPGPAIKTFKIDATNKTPQEVYTEIETKFESELFNNTIVLLRCFGILSEGKVQDIDFRSLFKLAYDQGAYLILKNTHKLQSKLFEEVEINSTHDNIEEDTIMQQLQDTNQEAKQSLVNELLRKLNTEQYDGEKKGIFTERIIETAKGILEKN